MSCYAPYASKRAAALTLLNSDHPFNFRQASFLGQACKVEGDLSVKQRQWMNALLTNAGFADFHN